MKYAELMQLMQETLKMTDAQFADYLKTDVTTVRRVRGGSAEIPAHTKMLVLDRAGFIKLTNIVLSIFPAAIQAKLQAAINNQALSLAQQNALAVLQEEVQDQAME
jgi:hypothetical protein